MTAAELPNLVLLGPQGSGKGTQAALLAKHFGYTVLGMGELLRKRAAQGDRFGQQIKRTIDRGSLVSEAVLDTVLSEAIARLAPGTPIIFDGVPRDTAQVKMFETILDRYHHRRPIVIVFRLPRAVSIERIRQRRTCNECGHAIGFLAKIAGKIRCPSCGNLIEVRADDSAEAIERRLNIYYEQTVPVIEHYRRAGRIVEIDGVGTIDEVYQRIVQALKI